MTGVNGAQAKPMGPDMAVLDLQERRTDLPCQVIHIDPKLGFDLKLHVPFQVKVPMSAFYESDNMLTMVFRVTPKDGEPAYFYQRTGVPRVEEGSSGDLYANGSFDVGPGEYHVDFMVRDRAQHFCSEYWDFTAKADEPDGDVKLALLPGAIAETDQEYFREEPPVLRSKDETLRVKILVNFAPQKRYAAKLETSDYLPLISILRGVSRQPMFAKFSLIAFNLEEQRVFYRQEDADRIDFPTLGDAIENVTPSVVSVSALGENAEADFLSGLITQELNGAGQVDALIFAGPKTLVDERISKQILRDIGPVKAPMFYLNYNANPVKTPWRDAIGHAVRFWKGIEYTITRPRDLGSALSDMVSNVLKSRETQQDVSASVH